MYIGGAISRQTYYGEELSQVQDLYATNLFDVLHPLGHLGVSHVVDILDEGVVLLPECHLGAGSS